VALSKDDIFTGLGATFKFKDTVAPEKVTEVRGTVSTSIGKKLEQAGFTKVTDQNGPYRDDTTPQYYYMRNNDICQMGGNSVSVDIACADKAELQKMADTLKPFYLAKTNLLVYRTPVITESKTPGYKIAYMYTSGPGHYFFYSKDTGKTWIYFSHTSDEWACDKFKTADEKAAFKGQLCSDTKTGLESTVQ